MAQGNVERQEKDKQRKLEIQRQEQLLSGRIQRAKTEEHGDPSGRGPGIQIYHYKDPGEKWQNLLLTSEAHCQCHWAEWETRTQGQRIKSQHSAISQPYKWKTNLTNIQLCHPPSISSLKQGSLFRGGADCEEHEEGGDPTEDEPRRAAEKLQQRQWHEH